MVRRTLHRQWQRVRMPTGKLYYWTRLSDYVITQVWQDGSFWRWAVVGFTMAEHATGRQAFIWRHGTGETMNEAAYYCEAAVPDDADEQLVMVLQGNLP